MSYGLFAFVLLHEIVPVVSVGLYGASPIWIAGNLVFSLAVIRTLQYSKATLSRVALCLGSGGVMTLTLMLGASFYMQGTGFNAQYFYHLDFATLVIASRAYGEVFYPSLLLLVGAFLAPSMLYKVRLTSRPGTLVLAIFWLVSAATCHPIHSAVTYVYGYQEARPNPLSEVPYIDGPTRQNRPAPSSEAALLEGFRAQPKNAEPTRKKKNIIVIYAESLERLYFNKTVFGDLVPNLRKLSKQAQQFTNVHQVRGATWTIAGIVASQCGFPLIVRSYLAKNSTISSTEKPFESESCLGDILAAEGYRTVYLGGSPLEFAGKGNFLRTHGYQTVMGTEALLPLLADPAYRSNWGLYDDSLFEIALEQVTALESGGDPYLLTLLTLDTHHPQGHPSRSCEKLEDNPDSMSNAIYCSDQLISDFILRVMEIVDMDNTVITLFSDHVALRNTLSTKLLSFARQRRLTWMIFDDQPGSSSNQVATHFDFAPTLLQRAGVEGYPELSYGRVLAKPEPSHRPGGVPTFDLAAAPRTLNPNSSVVESGFEIDADEHTIRVGDLVVKATREGIEFVSGSFLVVLDEQGRARDTVFSRDLGELSVELEGMFVIGLLIQPESSDLSDRYFFGRMSREFKDMTVRPLESDVIVGPNDVHF